MSKYGHLWMYIDLIFKQTNKEKIELSFDYKNKKILKLGEITPEWWI